MVGVGTLGIRYSIYVLACRDARNGEAAGFPGDWTLVQESITLLCFGVERTSNFLKNY